MSKFETKVSSLHFSIFISRLEPDEIAAYIIEAGRNNGQIQLKNIVNDSSNCSPTQILTRSFNFQNSIKGQEYWNEICLRLLDIE